MLTGRGLSHPKEFGVSDYNEDALYCLEDISAFSISDGVGSALFSDIWSRELSKTICEAKAVVGEVSFDAAMTVARQQWHGQIDWASLDYFRKKKFSRQGGSFATLLYGLVDSIAQTDTEEVAIRLWCYGDCNLFHIRGNQCILTWPWSTASDFGPAPPSLCSTTISPADPASWASGTINLRQGDSLLLATDALAEYLVKQITNERDVQWSRFSTIDQTEFANWIEELRDTNTIERDDTTFLLVNYAEIASDSESPAATSNWIRHLVHTTGRGAPSAWGYAHSPQRFWSRFQD